MLVGYAKGRDAGERKLFLFIVIGVNKNEPKAARVKLNSSFSQSLWNEEQIYHLLVSIKFLG